MLQNKHKRILKQTRIEATKHDSKQHNIAESINQPQKKKEASGSQT